MKNQSVKKSGNAWLFYMTSVITIRDRERENVILAFLRSPQNVFLISWKWVFLIVQVNKEESIALRRMIPNVSITITSKQKNHGRKKYFVEETRVVLEAINALRAASQIYTKWGLKYWNLFT